jgi:HK97 family phage major capsid protein
MVEMNIFMPVSFLEKSEAGYLFELCGLPFGGPHNGKDLHRQYFENDTDFQMSIGDQIPAVHFHGRDEKGQRTAKPEFYGKATLSRFDRAGGWFTVLVDKSKKYAEDFVQAAKDNTLRASTSPAGTLARFDHRGKATLWVPGEISLIVQKGGATAVNDYAIGLQILKAMYNENDIPWSEALEKARQDEITTTEKEKGIMNLTEADITALVDKKVAELSAAPADPATIPEDKPSADQPGLSDDVVSQINTTIEKAVVEQLRKLNPNKKAPAYNTINGGLNRQFWGEKAFDDPIPAFNHWLRTNQPNDDLADYAYGGEKAAWQEGTDSEGGYTVLDTVEPRIMEYRDERSIARIMGAEVIPVSGKLHDVPLENTRLTDWAITAEEGAWDQNEGDLGVAAITTYKWTKLQLTSDELLEDSEVDLLAFYTRRWGRSWGVTENLYFLTGTGSGQPQGALVGGTKAQDAASATALTTAEILANYFALDQPYRDPSAAWTMLGSTNAAIRALSGDPFTFIPTPQGALNFTGPDELMEMRSFESIKMPSMADANKALLFANWAAGYIITERRGIRIRRNEELHMNTGQVGHYVDVREGGAVGIAEAMQYTQMLDV